MTPERFQALADSFGSDLRRWPADERAGALECLRIEPRAADWLANAAALDRALDRYLVASPAPGLRAAVLDAAPGLRSGRASMVAPHWPSGWWWSGAAGLGLAGAACGALVVSMTLSAGMSSATSSSFAGGIWTDSAFERGQTLGWSDE